MPFWLRIGNILLEDALDHHWRQLHARSACLSSAAAMVLQKLRLQNIKSNMDKLYDGDCDFTPHHHTTPPPHTILHHTLMLVYKLTWLSMPVPSSSSSTY